MRWLFLRIRRAYLMERRRLLYLRYPELLDRDLEDIDDC